MKVRINGPLEALPFCRDSDTAVWYRTHSLALVGSKYWLQVHFFVVVRLLPMQH